MQFAKDAARSSSSQEHKICHPFALRAHCGTQKEVNSHEKIIGRQRHHIVVLLLQYYLCNLQRMQPEAVARRSIKSVILLLCEHTVGQITQVNGHGFFYVRLWVPMASFTCSSFSSLALEFAKGCSQKQ